MTLIKLKIHLTKGKGEIRPQSYFQSIAYVYLFDILQNWKMYKWSMKLLLEWRKKQKKNKKEKRVERKKFLSMKKERQMKQLSTEALFSN